MILLSKYGRQEDIIVGTPISARTHKDTEGMLGMFANTLAMRGAPVGRKIYVDFLREIKEKCLKAYKYQEYPFEDLVESVNIVNDTSRNPIFDVMFVLQEDVKTELNLNGLEMELVEQESHVSKFDLTFKIINTNDNYISLLEYDTDLFKHNTAKSINYHFIKILEEITDDPNKRIDEIQMITKEEHDLILNKFNATEKDYLYTNYLNRRF